MIKHIKPFTLWTCWLRYPASYKSLKDALVQKGKLKPAAWHLGIIKGVGMLKKRRDSLFEVSCPEEEFSEGLSCMRS